MRGPLGRGAWTAGAAVQEGAAQPGGRCTEEQPSLAVLGQGLWLS